MKKVILFALLVASVTGSSVMAQNKKTSSTQPIQTSVAVSNVPVGKDVPAKKDTKVDKKEVSKPKKETKQVATPSK